MANSENGDEQFNISTKIQLSGVLLKRPFGHQSTKWSKRFFIVKEGFLLYYPENERKVFEKRGYFNIHPKGVIPLGGCRVDPVCDIGQQFAVHIKSDEFNNGFVALATENQYEREKWIQILQEASRITWKNTQLGESLIRELETQGLQLCRERQDYFDKLQEETMALRDEMDKNEDAVEVIPSSWLITPQRCFWPPYKSVTKINQLTRESKEPDDDWQNFKIRLMCKADSYLKAREKCSKAQLTSGLDTCDSEVERERSRLRRKRTFSSSSDSNSDDAILPHFQKRTKQITRKPLKQLQNIDDNCNATKEKPSCSITSMSLNKKETQTLVQQQDCFEESLEVDFIPFNERGTNKGMEVAKGNTNHEGSLESSDKYANDKGAKLQPCCTPALKKSFSNMKNQGAFECADLQCKAADKKMLFIMEDIRKEIREVKGLLHTLMKSSEKSTDIPLPDNLPNLPVSSVSDIEDLNDKLKVKDTFVNLSRIFGCFGGSDYQDGVRLVLSRLMENNVAKQFNWSGKGNKLPFKILGYVCKLITSATRRNPAFSSVSEKEMENVIKKWLQYAGDRDGGRRELEKVTAELDIEKRKLEKMMLDLKEEHESIRREYEETIEAVKQVHNDKIHLQETTDELQQTLQELAAEKERTLLALKKQEEENCKLSQTQGELQTTLKAIEEDTKMLLEEKQEIEQRFVENELHAQVLAEEKKLISEHALDLQSSLQDLIAQKALTETELKEEIMARIDAERHLRAAEDSLYHLEKVIYSGSGSISDGLRNKILPDVKRLKKFFEDVAEEAKIDANKPIIMKNAVLARKKYAQLARSQRIQSSRNEKARSLGILLEDTRTGQGLRRSLSTILTEKSEAKSQLSVRRSLSTRMPQKSKKSPPGEGHDAQRRSNTASISVDGCKVEIRRKLSVVGEND